jgi:hypothetical protein
VRSLRMICSGVWRLRFMGRLLAKPGRQGSSQKNWFSFWGPRQSRPLPSEEPQCNGRQSPLTQEAKPLAE